MLNDSLKGMAVFMSFLIVFSVFSVYNVEASGPVVPNNCCLRTTDDQFCVNLEDYNTIDNCEGDLVYGSCDAQPDCVKGVCVPLAGQCLADYTRAQCTAIGGEFYEGQNVNEVSQCQIGCCASELTCGVMQENECVNGEFSAGVSDQSECAAQCRSDVTLGCFIDSNSCSYGKVGDFDLTQGDFNPEQFCYEFTECSTRYESHAYTAPGDDDLIPESSLDVYWYDSAGNMEERVGEPDAVTGEIHEIPGVPESVQTKGDCDFPDEKAFDPDGKGGRENAYCKSTACVLDCENCEPSSFRNGDSICLHIFKGQFTNEKRSKYLSEYILTCRDGIIEVSKEIRDRSSSVCYDGSAEVTIGNVTVNRSYAKVLNNNWEACLSCGEGGGIFDYSGYVPGAGGLILSSLDRGNWCAPKDGGLFGGTPGNVGGSEKCEDLGREQGIQMCYYDSDFWAPVGSCNPIYVPNKDTEDQCNKCGKGGDGKANLCTEQECNALGDCQFESDGTFSNGMLASGTLALGTAAGTVGFGYAACQLARGIPGFSYSGCISGVLNLVHSLVGNRLYWGVAGTLIGLRAASQQDYEELDRYGFSFVNKRTGKYDLASMIALARAVQYANASDEDLSNAGEELSSTPDQSPTGYEFGTGFIQGLTYLLHEDLIKEGALDFAEDSLDDLAFAFGWPRAIATKLYKVLNTVGAISSVIFVSESFNTGSCKPEEPYYNSDHCEECGGAEGQFYCTKQRCDILGGAAGYCRWEAKGDGTEDGVCLPVADPSDVTPPKIKKIKLEMYDQNGAFVGEREVENGPLETQEFSWEDAVTVKLNLTTNEESKCAYGFEHGKEFFNDEGNVINGVTSLNGRFTKDHEVEFNLTAAQKSSGEVVVYLKCMDVNGAQQDANNDDYYVKIHVGEEPDYVPPEIVRTDPAESVFLPEGTNGVEFSLIVRDKDGVSECKYSPGNVTNYEELGNLFSKPGSTACEGSVGRDCDVFKANLVFSEGEGLSASFGVGAGYGENATVYTYSLGCKDSYGNANVMNYGFTVYPGYDFNITYPTEGARIYDNDPVINLSVDVPVYCRYKVDDAVNWTKLNGGIGQPWYRESIGPLSASVSGVQHRLAVRCIDQGNNLIDKSVDFFVMSDADSPKVVRVYTRGDIGLGGKLYVEFDEEAECKYSTENLDFDFEDEDVSLMNAVPPGITVGDRSLSKLNSLVWEVSKYYIRCRDKWGNEEGYIIYP